jgi:preprotein translocase subunit YajC
MAFKIGDKVMLKKDAIDRYKRSITIPSNMTEERIDLLTAYAGKSGTVFKVEGNQIYVKYKDEMTIRFDKSEITHFSLYVGGR